MRTTREQRINQEAEMYRLGFDAAGNAVGIENWPKVGKPYSREWYRCKHAWQHGYRCFQLDGDQKTNPITPVENYPPYRPDVPYRDQLAARMVNIILTNPSISLRALCRKFSSRERQTIIDIVTEWYDKDILNLEYKGKRTSPTKILGFSEIPVIESYLSAQPGNSPASPPLEPEVLPDYQKFSESALGRQIDAESDKRENQYAASGCMMSDPRTQKALEGLFNPEPPFRVAKPSPDQIDEPPADEFKPIEADYTESDALADNLRNGDRPIETEETE